MELRSNQPVERFKAVHVVAELNITISIPDERFLELLNSNQPFSTLLLPPGVNLYQAADLVSQGKPIHIVETGCLRDTHPSAWITDGWSTFYFAKWIKAHPESKFTSIELAPEAIEKCKTFLQSHGLAEYVQFVNGSSAEEILDLSDTADLFFLDAGDGLEAGLVDFKAALTHNPKLIIMDDFGKKVALAAEYASNKNIPYVRIDRYTVFTTGPITFPS